MSEPVVPKDVRATMPDGEVVPATLTFVGYVDGQAVWEADFGLPVPTKGIRVGELPPYTSIQIRRGPVAE